MSCLFLSHKFITIIFLCYTYCTELNGSRGEEPHSSEIDNGLTFGRNDEVESLKAAVGIDSAEKALIFESKTEKLIKLEAVYQDKALNQDLIKLFNGLIDELAGITKFYDYYDVLTLIDKSIALIDVFSCTPTIYWSKNAMNIKLVEQKIAPLLGSFKKLLLDVNSLYNDKKPEDLNLNRNKFEYIKNGLDAIKRREIYLFKQYELYSKRFKIYDYAASCSVKVPRLFKLKDYLENIRKKICPIIGTRDVVCSMTEKDVEVHADYFKNSFKTSIKKVYDELSECYEKEKKSLKFLFDIYRDILKNTEECMEELNIFKKILNGETNKRDKLFSKIFKENVN